MKKITFDPAPITAILVSRALLGLALVMLVGVANAYADLLFFRAIKDKETYAENQSVYERADYPPGSGREDLFVERTPRLRIQFKEINSVLVEKSQADADLQKAIEDAMRLMGREKTGKEEENPVYTVTFSLNEQGARKFKDFTQKHDRKLFAIKIKNQILDLVTFVGPFEGNHFSASLAENNINRLREILSPIEDKVTWK